MKSTVVTLAFGCSLVLSSFSLAEPGFRKDALMVVDKLPVERVTLRDGTAIDVEVERVWRPIYVGDAPPIDLARFKGIVADLRDTFDNAPQSTVQNAQSGGGFDLQFNVIGSLPAGAAGALAAVEAYFEAQFSDSATVQVTFRMQSMGAGVLGSASSSYLSASYPIVRDALRADMDLDDVIQDWLPDTSTVPVRYNASSATVTAENRVFVTRANYNATIGVAGGTAASITLNTDFPWDYNPANGLTGGTWGFQSVLVQEVGHGLGFTSGVDFRTADMEMLDLYRFQRTDGTGDYNPDTLFEFQVRPRTLDFNNLNDDVNSDLISAEYRMEDGSPRQASHFRDNLGLGIMDPTLGSGQTFFPDFFSEADTAMFDAIGWDSLACGNGPGLDDLNGNGIADICERNAPTAEVSGTNCALCVAETVCVIDVCYVPKNRYLSVVPANPTSLTALRVMRVSSGAFMWIGMPDVDGIAPLVADPEYIDWSQFGTVIQAGGCFIVPNEAYDVQSLLDIDDPLDEANYTMALTLPTIAAWGDVTGSGDFPDGTADFVDITALVGCFSGGAGALPLARCDLAPQDVDRVADFVDISSGVDAFQSAPYPFVAPNACP